MGVPHDVTDTSQRVMEATLRHWDLTTPLPVPIGEWLACPVCRERSTIPKRYAFHTRPQSIIPHRCDISLKCRECAAVWVHGVAIPEAVYSLHGHRAYEREELKEQLKGTTWR